MTLIKSRRKFNSFHAYKGQAMKSIKAQAKERDRHRCLVCGTTKKLTIDHILPRSHGGANILENYQTLCQRCNNKKNDRDIDFINMSMLQKRLWLLEEFGPDWREELGM